jgi:hypothetical protein
LIINLRQTADEEADIALLQNVLAALKNFPGQDAVQFHMLNNGSAVPMNFAGLRTGFCPALERKLAEMMGEDGFRLDNV